MQHLKPSKDQTDHDVPHQDGTDIGLAMRGEEEKKNGYRNS